MSCRDTLMVELFGSDHEQSRSGERSSDVGGNESDACGDFSAADEDDRDEELSQPAPILGNADDGSNTYGNEIVEFGPQPGMLFQNLKSLFRAYQTYARSKGFSVVRRGSRLRKYSLMHCDRARKSAAKKKTKRIDCRSRVNAIKIADGSWQVSSVNHEHNHELCPDMSILMPAHRSLNIGLKRQLEVNDIAGIRVSKNVRLAEVQAGGPRNLGCLPKDCRNYIDMRRRLRLGDGDAEAIRRLFMQIFRKDPNFFHLMDIGNDRKLHNVLWIHPRSRAAYQEFYDVVSFDTTYLVNRYKMPFATFVGVNHHGQSILLGCALVSHEDASSFTWLFSNWIEAMGGVVPTCIITDQCESIKIAIKDVMPQAIHRYCLWHILCKLPVKVKGIANYDGAVKEFKGIVYDSLSIETFETKWSEFLVKYGVVGNEWLTSMFDERHCWVPVYLKHIFWAGMVSTQRSEGMHAFFDNYINSMSTLKQFVEQYEIAFADKFQKEFLADYDSQSKLITCILPYEWEKQFRAAYTNNIFVKFQGEIDRMLFCHVGDSIIDVTLGSDMVEVFKVLELSILNNYFFKEYTYVVTHRPAGEYIECNCKKFESTGILCSHILAVLCKEQIRTVNDCCILRRWRKDIFRPHSAIFFAGGYPHMTAEYKSFQEVERLFQDCTDAAFGSSLKMDMITQRCLALKGELLQLGSTTPISNCGEHTHTNPEPVVGRTPIQNPDVARTCGRPRSTRWRCSFEASNLPRNRGDPTRLGQGRGRGCSRDRGRGRVSGRGRTWGREGVQEDGSSSAIPNTTTGITHSQLECVLFDIDLNCPVTNTTM